jgi:predicted NBD/HSP70 family sugar kinase
MGIKLSETLSTERPHITALVGVLCIEDDFIGFSLEGRSDEKSDTVLLDYSRLPLKQGSDWFQYEYLNQIARKISARYKDELPLDFLSISIFGGVDSKSGILKVVPRNDVRLPPDVDVKSFFLRLVKSNANDPRESLKRIEVNNDTITMALGHAQKDSNLLAYAHFGRGVGCGMIQGQHLLRANGRHSEFGHYRARIIGDDMQVLQPATGAISNCRFHGGSEDTSDHKIPCFDGLLSRSTLNRLPDGFDKYSYFTRYAAQMLAIIALSGAPNHIYVGGSSIRSIATNATKTINDIRTILEKELSGFPSFPTASRRFGGDYIRLSKWSDPSQEFPHETAASKGASILAWQKF